MKKLSKEQFEEYSANPLATDEKLRVWLDLPDNRYYTVSIWPEEFAGRVFVRTPTEKDKARIAKAKKVSKSDQK